MTDERTAPVKFTAATVREVSARVERFTNGRFALQATGTALDNGTRYFDAHQMTVWYGPQGARQACAYYIGGAFGTQQAEGREIPEDDTVYLKRVLDACVGTGTLANRQDCSNWEQQGRERARLMAEVANG